MPAPSISVVLCARNSAETLERQLAALSRQETNAPFEVLVVDNGSVDGTHEVAALWAGRLPLRVLDEPIAGVNRARNRGVHAASATLIALCDSDDEADAGWLGALSKALGEFDLAGGRLEHFALSHPNAAFRDLPQSDHLPAAMGMPYAMGANLGFRRRVFDAIGGFDPVFDFGCDDVDFCLRAAHAGFSIGFAEDAVMHYRNRHGFREVIRQRFAYGRGDERLVRRHAELGFSSYRYRQRAKVIAVRGGRALKGIGNLARQEDRVAWLAGCAFLAGLVFELVTGSLRHSVDASTHRSVTVMSRPRGASRSRAWPGRRR